jgi:hypothetical protein
VATERDTKQCPDCAERVLAEAKVCRFCGYRFAPPDGAPRGLLWSLFGTRSGRSESLSAVEILAGWKAGLADNESVELLALGRVGDHDGYLAITDRRLLFFQHVPPKTHQLVFDQPLTTVRSVERTRGHLEARGDSWQLTVRDLSSPQAERAADLLSPGSG